MSGLDIGYAAPDNTFNLWVDGQLVARIPLADALALAATVCRVAAEREATAAKCEHGKTEGHDRIVKGRDFYGPTESLAYCPGPGQR